MLASAVGIVPFKDNFRSSSATEPWADAEALISSLSAGMVGPSDGIGELDAELLLRTCRSDGVLLKPDGPAVPIDAMFLEHERPYVVHARSTHDVGTWSYVAAFHLASGHEDYTSQHSFFAIVAYDGVPIEQMVVLPEVVRDWHVDLARDLRLDGPVVAYDWRTGTAALVDGRVELAPVAELYGHAYYVLAPVLDNGLALIGETDKFIAAADRRFEHISTSADALEIALVGAPGETVTLVGFDTVTSALLAPVAVVIDEQGQGHATIAR
jgi:hypothetical protein